MATQWPPSGHHTGGHPVVTTQWPLSGKSLVATGVPMLVATQWPPATGGHPVVTTQWPLSGKSLVATGGRLGERVRNSCRDVCLAIIYTLYNIVYIY